ncbi:hypothetical protein PFISCL1PPCAC_3677, partial [Pristionchus fissidentatus]
TPHLESLAFVKHIPIPKKYRCAIVENGTLFRFYSNATGVYITANFDNDEKKAKVHAVSVSGKLHYQGVWKNSLYFRSASHQIHYFYKAFLSDSYLLFVLVRKMVKPAAQTLIMMYDCPFYTQSDGVRSFLHHYEMDEHASEIDTKYIAILAEHNARVFRRRFVFACGSEEVCLEAVEDGPLLIGTQSESSQVIAEGHLESVYVYESTLGLVHIIDPAQEKIRTLRVVFADWNDDSNMICGVHRDTITFLHATEDESEKNELRMYKVPGGNVEAQVEAFPSARCCSCRTDNEELKQSLNSFERKLQEVEKKYKRTLLMLGRATHHIEQVPSRNNDG